MINKHVVIGGLVGRARIKKMKGPGDSETSPLRSPSHTLVSGSRPLPLALFFPLRPLSPPTPPISSLTITSLDSRQRLGELFFDYLTPLLHVIVVYLIRAIITTITFSRDAS
jgi:hypothetical protein